VPGVPGVPTRFADSEAGLQFLAVAATQSQVYAIIQYHSVFTVGTHLQLSDTGKVHNCRALDAEKGVRIQLLFQV
jgi:hypothetical protein